MKNILILVGFLIIFTGCSKPGDCIESTGNIIAKEFSVPNFDKIIVYEGIGLVLTQGPEFKVEAITGENLMEGIEVKVTDSLLSLKDNTSCNWVRDYGHTTIYVTAPNIIELHSKTERTISSNGILTYPILRLFSIDLTDGVGTGDFNIQVDNGQTVVENNNIARYYISGQTNDLQIYFYDGNGRFEGENLTAKSINIYHRGSNDMVVKPTEIITGKMVSTGNLVLKNTPPINEVQALFTGHVIYN